MTKETVSKLLSLAKVLHCCDSLVEHFRGLVGYLNKNDTFSTTMQVAKLKEKIDKLFSGDHVRIVSHRGVLAWTQIMPMPRTARSCI